MKLTSVFLVSVMMLLGCSSNGQQAKNDGRWEVTITGKVGFPKAGGTITITELTSGGNGWQDTIALKSNYTYSKKIKIKEPGYYKLNFYNTQSIDFILYKSNVEINVDGNKPSGFFEIKGSPELDQIRYVQETLNGVQSTPEAQKLDGRSGRCVRGSVTASNRPLALVLLVL